MLNKYNKTFIAQEKKEEIKPEMSNDFLHI